MAIPPRLRTPVAPHALLPRLFLLSLLSLSRLVAAFVDERIPERPELVVLREILPLHLLPQGFLFIPLLVLTFAGGAVIRILLPLLLVEVDSIIVELPLLRVAERFIRCSHQVESGRRSAGLVRVHLETHQAIRTLELGLGGVRRYAENRVIVLVGGRRLSVLLKVLGARPVPAPPVRVLPSDLCQGPDEPVKQPRPLPVDAEETLERGQRVHRPLQLQEAEGPPEERAGKAGE
mmetsp:Transcript_52365/g.157159  ORF Transcript_52365/g.157159 Transcript_52365/m.157159 type:complete len:234 (+) Transcript_52365:94-795(+)